MILRWDGRDWDWDPEAVTVAMARQIRDFTGRGLRSWTAGISDGEPDSLLALWWAVQLQNGVTTNIAELDIPPAAFYRAVDDAARGELRRLEQAAGRAEKSKFSPKETGPTKRPTRTSGRTATGRSSS